MTPIPWVSRLKNSPVMLLSSRAPSLRPDSICPHLPQAEPAGGQWLQSARALPAALAPQTPAQPTTHMLHHPVLPSPSPLSWTHCPSSVSATIASKLASSSPVSGALLFQPVPEMPLQTLAYPMSISPQVYPGLMSLQG